MQTGILSFDRLPHSRGAASVRVSLLNNKVESVLFDFSHCRRFFEEGAVNQNVEQTAVLNQKICAHCAVFHQLAFTTALERAQGITQNTATLSFRDELRKLSILKSHAQRLFTQAIPKRLGNDSIFDVTKKGVGLLEFCALQKTLDFFIQNVYAQSRLAGPAPPPQARPLASTSEIVMEPLIETATRVKAELEDFPQKSFSRRGIYFCVRGDTILLEGGKRQPVSESIGGWIAAIKSGAMQQELHHGGPLSRYHLGHASEFSGWEGAHNPLATPFLRAVELEKGLVDSAVKIDFFQSKNDEADFAQGAASGTGLAAVEGADGPFAQQIALSKGGRVKKWVVFSPTDFNRFGLRRDILETAGGEGNLRREAVSKNVLELVCAYDLCWNCATVS